MLIYTKQPVRDDDVMFASLHRMERDPSTLPELKATLTLSVCYNCMYTLS